MSRSAPDLSRLRIESKDRPRRAWRWGWIASAAAAVIIVFAFISQRRNADEPGPRVASQAEQPQQPSDERRAAVPQPTVAPEKTLSATGYVVAQRRAAVSSKATGRLKSLAVVEGDTVVEGQILATLENDDLRALLLQQEAALTASHAQVESALAELEDARLNRNRVARLVGGNAVSQAEADQAEARLRRAAAAVDLARANVRTAEAQVAKAKVDLEYTFIRAPFAGTVLTKDADVGEIVAPFGSSTNARAAVVTIADMGSLEVEADISEANIAKVRVGQSAEITLDSYPGKVYRGTVDKIVPTVDRAKATVLVKIRFQDRDERVLPEMSAKISLHVGD